MRKFMAAVLLALAAMSLPGLAANVGDDGLHKSPWMRETFLDLREDLAEANAEGKRLALMIEQRGCIYCKMMHEEVYPQPRNRAVYFRQLLRGADQPAWRPGGHRSGRGIAAREGHAAQMGDSVHSRQ